MTQWAEIRHLHLVDGVPKKEIARQLKLDVKTVRRAIGRSTPPVRVSPAAAQRPGPVAEADHAVAARGAAVDREADSPVAAAVGRAGPRAHGAALRRGLKTAVAPKEAFVHRSVLPGTTLEVDFGESRVDIAGVPCKVKYLVATLSYSNAYFAKAYPVERIESLLDGIESAFRYFQGVVKRVILDNTSLAVKGGVVGAGPDRDRSVRGVPGRESVPSRVLRAGEGLGEGFCGMHREIRQEPRVPAAAGGGELGGAQRGDHHGAGGGPADAAPRRRTPGRGSAGAGAAASASDARSLARDLPRRPAGRRQVRARAGGQGHLLGADPPRLPAGVGEAVPRLGGDRGRCRGGAEHRREFCWGAKVLDGLHVLPLPSGSTAPWPRRRRFSTGGWFRCGSRRGPSSPSTPASPTRNGSGCCG